MIDGRWGVVAGALLAGCGSDGFGRLVLNDDAKSEPAYSFSDANYRLSDALDGGGQVLTVALLDWDGEACDAIDGVLHERQIVLTFESDDSPPFSASGMGRTRDPVYQGLAEATDDQGAPAANGRANLILTAFDPDRGVVEGIGDVFLEASYQVFFSARSCE